jgi:trimeric autotransporter adhesin
LILFSAESNLQVLTWFNDGVNGFAMLTPAQPLTPTPYAISAVTAASSVTATFATSVAGIAVQSNTNGAPNVITGSTLNFVGTGVVGATISGGGATNYLGHAATNSVVGVFGTVGGGFDNSAGVSATVAGGEGNSATNFAATVAGGNSNTASGNSATVGGGYQNTATNTASTVAGGQSNAATGINATIGGGSQNAATNLAATVAGGQGNTAGGSSSTVGGGSANAADAQGATVAGGSGNIASANLATVGGGNANSAGAEWATVAGGNNNTATGGAATIPGGANNIASGDYAFAAGQYAQAVDYGSFVWSDASSFTPFSSSAENQFAVRAAGGVLLAADVTLSGGYHNFSLTGGNALGYLYGSYPALGDGVHLGYNYYYDAAGTGHVANAGGGTSRLTVGYGFISLNVGDVNSAPSTQCLYADSTGVTVNGTFNNQSDRNAKQHFAEVSPAQILDKVARLPISEWSYKGDVATRHVGPVAQDFYSIFNIGTDDKHIAPMDEGGVALAAIQGLNQKMNEKDQKLQEQSVQIEKQASEIEELKQQVKQLGQIVNTLNQKLGDADN